MDVVYKLNRGPLDLAASLSAMTIKSSSISIGPSGASSPVPKSVHRPARPGILNRSFPERHVGGGLHLDQQWAISVSSFRTLRWHVLEGLETFDQGAAFYACLPTRLTMSGPWKR